MPGFISGKIPNITVRQLVINKINTLSNFAFWCEQDDFVKYFDISQMIDMGMPLSRKQAESINRFLGSDPLTNEKLKEVVLRNGEKYQPY